MNREMALLRAALDRLPMLSRAVYLLHATHGLGIEDIAFCLGESSREALQHLAAALSSLSEAIDAGMGAPR